MFDADTIGVVEEMAAKHELAPAAPLAVAEIESGGKVFALVRGKKEPLVRWEGHYFDRRLKGVKRTRARKEGLASPTAGAIPNPKDQVERWAMVARAAVIDRQAALESFSIGLGQVMTSHWKWLGFDSVDELIKLARSGVAEQIELMVRYIVKAGVSDDLRN